MEPKIEEVASRIRSLREDLDISMQEMAQATGRSLSEYAAQESGEQDLSFSFLSKCAKRFGVDVVELLTGENPHLTGYSLIREGDGLSVKRRAGFEYLHKAPSRSWSRCPIFPKSRTNPSIFPITAVRKSTASFRDICASPTKATSRNWAPATCLCTIRVAGMA